MALAAGGLGAAGAFGAPGERGAEGGMVVILGGAGGTGGSGGTVLLRMVMSPSLVVMETDGPPVPTVPVMLC